MLLRFAMAAALVLAPAMGWGQTSEDPALTTVGALWYLIPIAIVSAAVIGALIWKKPTTYQGSLDILRKRRHGSEARPGFVARIEGDIEQEQEKG